MKRLLVLVALLLSIVPVLAQEETPETELVHTRSSAPDPANIQLETVAEGFNRPLFVTNAGDGSGALYVLEQGGTIYRLLDGERSIFLDLTDTVSEGAAGPGYSERGLLGLAFHPDYAENGVFFVNYTDRAGTTNVARYRTVDGEVDVNNAEVILTQTQPFPNHNGGHMAFGADGYLYISLGDGGAANDPLNTGQDPTDWLGSILRIDVNGETGYAIPEDNPFADGANGAPEVWSYGLRNVWRFSFDNATGDMFLADVGQNEYEEVNFEPAGEGGRNYGWNAFEATHVFAGSIEGTIMPFAEYDHSQGCSVTGGYIYRGDALPDLQGVYLYGDYCTGLVWAAYRNEAEEWNTDLFLRTGFQISSFGEDEVGELYIVNYQGALLKIVSAE
jgi:glucose/arabinose dehydrogenase